MRDSEVKQNNAQSPLAGECRCQCGGAVEDPAPAAVAEEPKGNKLFEILGRLFHRRSAGNQPAPDAAMTAVVDELIAGHKGRERGVIELLQEISGRFGYLPPDAMRRISIKLHVPLSRLYALATFYHDFKMTPQGRHRLVICTGTACHVKGAAAIVDALCRELKLAPGETTPDGKLTVSTVNCIGLCGVGPVATLDGEHLSLLTPEKALKIASAL